MIAGVATSLAQYCADERMSKPTPLPTEPPARIRIGELAPVVDCGRRPAKRCVGDRVVVAADILRDGHDALRAAVQVRAPGRRRWERAPMTHVDAHLGGVHWEGSFTVDGLGLWSYRVSAWVDPLATWLDELRRKLEGGQEDLAGELSEGIPLLRARAQGARAADRRTLSAAADAVEAGGEVAALLAPEVAAAAERTSETAEEEHSRIVELQVDPVRARVGSWYELFPGRGADWTACGRSCPTSPSWASTSST